MQTTRGIQQAEAAGQKIKALMDEDNLPYSLFFYTSPYKRSRQTYEAVSEMFAPGQLKGTQEEVQLREQDFGNFQVRHGGCQLRCIATARPHCCRETK